MAMRFHEYVPTGNPELDSKDPFAFLAKEKLETKKQPSSLTMGEKIDLIFKSNESNEIKVQKLDELIDEVVIGLQVKTEKIQEGKKYQLGNSLGMPTKYDNDRLWTTIDSGKNWQEVSAGELMTDGEWSGVSYSVNSSRIPNEVCLQFIEAQANIDIRRLTEIKTMIADMGSEQVNRHTKEVFASSLAERREGIVHFGHVAELMVKNFLTKLSIDNELDIEVQMGDVYQDVEQKVDLIIKRIDHVRGVVLEENHRTASMAIQLTINSAQEVLERKNREIKRVKGRLIYEGTVDDIALVQIGAQVSAEMKRAYEAWNRNKTPGGPDKLLSLKTQELLFKTILEKMYTPEELEQRWQQIADQKNS